MAQLARAAAFACGVERARLPLYVPGAGWRERVGFPLADAPRHLDASTTAAAIRVETAETVPSGTVV